MKHSSSGPVEEKTEHDQNSYAGVFPSIKKDGSPSYRASLTYRGKHISLGSFSTPEKAHAAYQEGTALLSNRECTLLSYGDNSPLSFGKWVCLINFRDNGLYFGNPIYMGIRMFYYYLSPTLVLKFDLDDLFYYSSHKIMHRGNHYFVADYGMQVGILTRYGIRPYARQGRDFLFVNGDNTDFRRENLKLLNRYQGVCQEYKNGQYIYTVRIHIKGNYIVGRYATELEAAIAYNKAVDILRQKGVTRNFTVNYIEGISPSRYAEIYASLEISPRIMAYTPAQERH